MEIKNTEGRIKAALYFVLILLIAACCNKTAVTAERNYSKEGFVSLKVKNPGIAGCDYILSVADSTVYQPLNLDQSFRKDGTEVWAKFHKEKNMMTACMMGEVITIDEIHLRK
jgi:hypothetical protein